MILDTSQKNAVYASLGKSHLVHAGPGSGKTRVLIARIIHLLDQGIAPEQILAITFTRRAAAVMGQRLADEIGIATTRKVYMGTFHALCLRILHFVDPPAKWVISEAEWHAVAREAINRYHPGEAHPERLVKRLLRAIADERRRFGLRTSEDRRIRYVYTMLRIQGLVDYEMLELRVADILYASPSKASMLRSLWTDVVVDETQDLAARELFILEFIANRIYAVGDENQRIYSWRTELGQDPLETVRRVWKPDEHVLSTSYRCARVVLAAAGALFSVPSAADKAPDGSIEISAQDYDTPEPDAIANYLRKQHSAGVAWRDMAILARSHRRLYCAIDDIPDDIPLLIQPSKIGVSSGDMHFIVALRTQAIAYIRGEKPCDLKRLLVELSEKWHPSDSTFAAAWEAIPWGIVAVAREAARPDSAAWVDRDTDAVRCLTIHAAKGLEWEAVVIPGWEDGEIPLDGSEEERRVAYVALSRAKHSLLLTRRTWRYPSRFLDSISRALDSNIWRTR